MPSRTAHSRMRKPIVVVGSINLDLVATADHVPLPGETIIGKDFRTFHGGKGANQAVGVAKLGHPVSMLGNVGDDSFGTALKNALRQAGVAVNSVRTVKGASGVALINIGDDGQNNIVVVPGANGKLLPKDITAHSTLLRKAGMILAQLEIPLITLETVAAFAHRHQIPLMLDPAPARELPSGLLQVVAWITPNESETRILCGLAADGARHSSHRRPLRQSPPRTRTQECRDQNGRARRLPRYRRRHPRNGSILRSKSRGLHRRGRRLQRRPRRKPALRQKSPRGRPLRLGRRRNIRNPQWRPTLHAHRPRSNNVSERAKITDQPRTSLHFRFDTEFRRRQGPLIQFIVPPFATRVQQ